MLPKPDFSSLDKSTSKTPLHECSINKTATFTRETFSCIPCDQVFVDANDLKIHEEEHIPCGFAGCEFEANYKVLLDHQTSVHMNLKKKSIYSLESAEDIEKWRAERRKRFPKAVNTLKELSKSSQIEAVNSNECHDISTSLNSGLPTDHNHLPDAVGEKCEKQCANDSGKVVEAESCSPRKRAPICTYGSSERGTGNRPGNKRRRNQRKKHRDNHREEKDGRTNAGRQSNATCEGKSGGNSNSSLTRKAASASSLIRRPTLFEKLMQSNATTCKSNDATTNDNLVAEK